MIQNKNYLQSILIALSFLFLFLCNAYAGDYQVPSGCVANAYSTKCNLWDGKVIIDFYNNQTFACSAELSKTYTSCTGYQNQAYTVINAGSEEQIEGIAELNELIKFFFYFTFAIIIAVVFITGIKVMNS